MAEPHRRPPRDDSGAEMALLILIVAVILLYCTVLAGIGVTR